MRLLAGLAALAWAGYAQELPILGLNHAAFQVEDLRSADAFYHGVLGLDAAFQEPKPDGSPGLIFYKINDDQYLEVSAGLAAAEDRRMSHVAFQTNDLDKLHAILEAKGLKPTPIKSGKDKNRNFGVRDPEDNRLEFTQYMPGSLHSNAIGKSLSPNRISAHMMHAGIYVTDVDAALKFYRDRLGFQETWRGGRTEGELRWINLKTPGTRGDYIELMIAAPRASRDELGSMQHVCLEVADIKAAQKVLAGRGMDGPKNQPKVGRNGKWQLNLFDPVGSRVEVMEPRLAK
jgi:catechol 2,3-dioxygenase-like lactoylglutathione lyase family enzyme